MVILYATLFWFAGIWLGSHTSLSPLLWLLAGAILGLLRLLLRGSKSGRLALGLALLALGAGRMAAAAPVIDAGHVAFYNDGPPAVVEGRVSGAPEIRDRDRRIRVAASVLVVNGVEQRPVTGAVLATVPRHVEVRYGDRVALEGELETPQSGEEFDYRAYLARQGIFATMRRPVLRLLPEDGSRVWLRPVFDLRRRAMGVIDGMMAEPAGSLLTGILLGDDNGLPDDLADDFQTTGMTHIIAISGFNIAIIVGLLVRLGDPLLGRRGGVWFALLGIGAYTVMVGAEAAVVRAAIMGTLYLLSTRFMGRKTAPLATLFVAGAAMTVVNPHTLWDVGFQLSFGATLSLMLYATPLTDAVRRRLGERLSRRRVAQIMELLSDAVLVTVAAQILTLPLLIYHFEQISLISLPANALILPAQPAVMTWGGIATLLGLVAEPLARPFAWAAWLFLSYTIGMVRLLADVPLANLPLQMGLPGLLALYAAIAAFSLAVQPAARSNFLRFLDRVRSAAVRGPRSAIARQRSVLAALLALAALLILLWGRSQPDGRLHVVFLDVGQGDAIFIQTPGGRQLLIDGGLEPSVLNDRLGRQMPFWDRTLDVVIATHADADHIGGLADVFDHYQVAWLITDGHPAGETPAHDALMAAAATDGVVIHRALAGEVIDTGDGVRLHVLHPGPTLDPDNRNENSVSVRLVYGEFTLLLTGDAESGGERAMIRRGMPLEALVFKAGHHGSETSSNGFFLDVVRPRIVIVSAGAGNRYGHPHREVLERTAAVGAALLRTDELGTIRMISDGELMWWEAIRP